MRAPRLLWLMLAMAPVLASCTSQPAIEYSGTTTVPSSATAIQETALTMTPGVLTVATEATLPPFESYDAVGNVIGFDADLINEIADRLGLAVEWVDTDFDTIFTRLATGRFDLVAAAAEVTPTRAEQVLFTDPYYNAREALVANLDLSPGVGSVDDLGPGRSVAVQAGTRGAAWAIEHLADRGADIVEFPEADDPFNALEAGQVDAVIFSEPVAFAEAAGRAGLSVVDVIDTGQYFAFAVDPVRTELLARMNEALRAMVNDGTYQEIYAQWFDAPAGSIVFDPRGDWPETLVFGFVPSREIGEVQDDIDTFRSVLSDALGIEVEGFVATDSTGLGLAMGTGQADMGAFDPVGYVLASRTSDNLELLAQSVRFGDSTYHAQWYTNDPTVCGADPVEGAFYYDADGNVVPVGPTETPALQVGWNGDGTRDDTVDAGLRCPEPVDISVVIGKTVAFGPEGSIWGSLLPTLQLAQAKIADDQYDVVPGDDAIAAVYAGEADIGVALDDARRALSQEFPDVGGTVIALTITPPIANDVIAIRSDLPDRLKEAVFQAIATFISTENGAATMDRLIGWTSLVRADVVTERSLRPLGDAIDRFGVDG